MLRTSLLTLIVLSAPLPALADSTRIAFGSCMHQDKETPILKTVIERQPDAFVFLGDNVYGDTTDMELLRSKYQKQGAKPEFQALKQAVPLYAIWDDHDYGANDAGKEYPQKPGSRKLMLDFFGEPASSPRRTRADGNYASYWIEDDGHFVHLILPDLRWNRDALKKSEEDDLIPGLKAPDSGPYQAAQGRTMLGESQWQWLEKELLKPADLTIIGSGIQLVPEFTGWESWANFPDDRSRLLSFMEEHEIPDVIILSGDRHFGEISRTFINHPQPLWEVTSSGLNNPTSKSGPNRNRVSDTHGVENFGELDIVWSAGTVELSLYDINGKALEQFSMILSER